MRKRYLGIFILSVALGITNLSPTLTYAAEDNIESSTDSNEIETEFETENSHENEFVLRNGIYFGDSMEQVKKKETLKFKSDNDETPDENGETTLWTELGKISGIDDAQVMFSFIDDALVEMKYSFATYTDSDIADGDYDKIHDGLIRKYGDPLNNTGGDVFTIVTDTLTTSIVFYSLISMVDGGFGDYYDYDEWIVYGDDYNVKIDMILYYVGGKNLDTTYFLTMGYKCFTDEDLINEIEKKQEERDEIDNDL